MGNDKRNLNKIVIYPTDTVWGIGASVFDKIAQESIAKIKKTEISKPNSVLFYNSAHLLCYLSHVPSILTEIINKKQFELGLSVLIKKDNFKSIHKYIPETTDFVSIRILEYAPIRNLINDYFCGHPITTTSLNFHGENPIIQEAQAIEFQKKFQEETFLFPIPKLIPYGLPSTIIKIDDNESIQVIREGQNFKKFLENMDYSSPRFYRFNEDSIKLVKFILKNTNMIQIKNVLDFCCGNGIIGIEMARSYKGNSIESITFLEKQTEFSEHLNLNLKFLDSSIRVNVVFNDFKDFLTNEKFDLILSNPPFFREGHGRACDNLKKHLCRHQVNFTDDDLISFVRSHLSHTGVGYLILPRALLDKKIEVHPIGKMFINCISV